MHTMVRDDRKNIIKKLTRVDLTSPYYLHHPAMNIYSKIPKGDNYQEYEKSMHNIFHAKCKLGFLDEAVKEIECVDVELED